MSLNLVSFVQSLVPTLSRSDLESDLETSLDVIKTILATYGDLNGSYSKGKFNSKEANAIATSFYKEYDAAKNKGKVKPSNSLAGDTIAIFSNAITNGERVKKEVAAISNEVIVSQAMTVVKVNIVRAVGHFYFMTKYALDLINYIYVLEAEHGGIELSKDSKPNAKQIEIIKKNMWLYARLVAVYGTDPKHFTEELDSLSTITVPKEQVEEVVSQYQGQKLDLLDNLPQGFIGSPIYTVRLVFAQWEADRYKKLRDQKKLLELRYLHLRMIQEQGGGDANTEKEMAYLQSRITDIDYKTSKIEESVE